MNRGGTVRLRKSIWQYVEPQNLTWPEPRANFKSLTVAVALITRPGSIPRLRGATEFDT